jgi:hypothetical protein
MFGEPGAPFLASFARSGIPRHRPPWNFARAEGYRLKYRSARAPGSPFQNIANCTKNTELTSALPRTYRADWPKFQEKKNLDV